MIYTDGACANNPHGSGGYGAIIVNGEQRLELSEGFRKTTNNRMELLGAITALEALNRPCEVDLYSDSSYVINAFEKNWIASWKKNGWRTASKAPVKNQDLWKRLLEAAAPHQISWHWVKGHAGQEMNERCDQLATAAADQMYNQKKPNLDPMTAKA